MTPVNQPTVRTYDWDDFRRTFKSFPSPNFNKGRLSHSIRAIVIHIMDGFQGNDSGTSGTRYWFSLSAKARGTASASSAHYGVGRNGVVDVYVAEENTAWHAGMVSSQKWAGLQVNASKQVINPNLYTIGIEHEGFPVGPNFTGDFTEEQYEASSKLIAGIAARYQLQINESTVITHALIDPARRINCPGKNCDMRKLIEMAKAWKVQL